MKALSRERSRAVVASGIGAAVFARWSGTIPATVAAREISDAALSATLIREFNEASFSLLTDSVRSAIAAAEQLPMMSERRVVRVRDFARLRDADEEMLIAYLGNPSPSDDFHRR